MLKKKKKIKHHFFIYDTTLTNIFRLLGVLKIDVGPEDIDYLIQV